jgi:hypothetical protein
MSDPDISMGKESSEATGAESVRALLDTDAVVHMLDHLKEGNALSARLNAEFSQMYASLRAHGRAVESLKGELRSALIELELIRSSLVSDVVRKGDQPRSLSAADVVQTFPPESPRASVGVRVAKEGGLQSIVDCSSRLGICKAACCRVFSIPLTASEVRSGSFEWNPRLPYTIQKTNSGCKYLDSEACACTIHPQRPSTCRSYDCSGDRRIWADFAAMKLNPVLERHLAMMDLEHCSTVESPTPGAEAHHGPDVRDGSESEFDASDSSLARSVATTPPDFEELRARLPGVPKHKFDPLALQ